MTVSSQTESDMGMKSSQSPIMSQPVAKPSPSAQMEHAMTMNAMAADKIAIMDGAVASNNLGVVYFANGDLTSAMEHFRQALVGTKLAFDESPVPQERISEARHSIRRARDQGTLASLVASCSSDSNFDKERSPIFSGAFAIAPPYIRSDGNGHFYFCSDPDVEGTILSANIIVNMAIASHLLALSPNVGERKDALLYRTKSLYGMGKQLLSNASNQLQRIFTREQTIVRGEFQAIFDLLSIIIIHNQAQFLCERFQEHLFMIVHCDHISQLACQARQRSYESPGLTMLVQQVTSFFLQATNQMIHQYVYAASAA